MPEFFNRPPRIQPELPTGEIALPTPPNIGTSARQSLVQLGVPLVTIAGYILVSTSGHGSNPLFVLPMALAVLASTVASVLTFRRQNRIDAEKTPFYDEQLAVFRSDLVEDHDLQRECCFHTFPD